MFDALFRFFFKLSPVVFSQGDFRFAASTGLYIAVAAGLTVFAYDDSRGMQIADLDGQPRSSYVKGEFGANDRGLLKALSERFTIRTFRFSSAATRTTQESDLTFTGSQSRLGAALSNVRQGLAGLPVAGLVMVSDGADTADAALGDAILGVKAEGLPVFTVGVGREALIDVRDRT